MGIEPPKAIVRRVVYGTHPDLKNGKLISECRHSRGLGSLANGMTGAAGGVCAAMIRHSCLILDRG
jgi:hypothetical protein